MTLAFPITMRLTRPARGPAPSIPSTSSTSSTSLPRCVALANALQAICTSCSWWQQNRCESPVGPCPKSRCREEPWRFYPDCPARRWPATASH